MTNWTSLLFSQLHKKLGLVPAKSIAVFPKLWRKYTSSLPSVLITFTQILSCSPATWSLHTSTLPVISSVGLKPSITTSLETASDHQESFPSKLQIITNIWIVWNCISYKSFLWYLMTSVVLQANTSKKISPKGKTKSYTQHLTYKDWVLRALHHFDEQMRRERHTENPLRKKRPWMPQLGSMQ